MRRSIRCPGTLITRRQAVDLDLNEASQLRGQSGLKWRGMPGQVKFHFKGWASARMHALPPLLSIHIRDEIRHRISDSCVSLPKAVPRVDPHPRLQEGLSHAHSTDSGQIQGSLMYFVPSWRPNMSL